MINFSIYTFLAFLFVIIQSSVLNILLPAFITPDLLAILVIYISLNRKFSYSVGFTLLASYFMGLYSVAGFYIIAVSLLIVLATSRYLTKDLYTQKTYYFLLSLFIPFLFGKIFLILWIASSARVFFIHIFYALSQSLLTALLALLVFKLFKFIDVKTHFIDEISVKES